MGKIMKYEFRSMFRLFIPMWLGLLILSVVNRFTTNLQFGNDKLLNFFVGLALFLYVVGIIAVIIVAYIFIVLRFYKGLLKDEGYLTMTLPVSLDSILWGKALAAWILMVLTTLVCLVSAGILLLANVNLRDLAAVWEQTVTYFGSAGGAAGGAGHPHGAFEHALRHFAALPGHGHRPFGAEAPGGCVGAGLCDHRHGALHRV